MISLGELRATDLPSRLGVCSTDDRLTRWANEAQLRLMSRPQAFWGTTRTISLAVNSDCGQTTVITPPWVAALRGAWDESSRKPAELRNGWYELGSPTQGYVPDDQAERVLTEIDSTPVTGTISTPSQVRAVSQAEDNDKVVRVRGLDANAVAIRSTCGDGETLTLAADAPPSTVAVFASVTGVTKDQTCAPVSLEWYDGTQWCPLVTAEPEESDVWRRRYRLDSMSATGVLAAIAKLKHRPVRYAEDLFWIENAAALMDMTEAIKARSERDYERAAILEGSAISLLVDELKNLTSESVRITWRNVPHGSNQRVFGGMC